MDASVNFVEIFKFYKNMIDKGTECYETEKAKLVMPIVPVPILRSLLETCRKTFENERTLMRVNQDVIVVGDIHGHILDLFRILHTFGYPPQQKYLFLGDLVDRGEFSMETAILILVMKAIWPNSVYLIRGNHEFSEMWESGGFRKEMDQLYYGERMFEEFQNCFSQTPVGAIVNQTILCIHGGIGPGLNDISQIQNLYRPIHSFDETAVDIFWSDPAKDGSEEFVESQRGTGHTFGQKALEKFLDGNRLSLLVRGHECTDEGVEYSLGGKLVTVFSCSSYCHKLNNKAGVLILKKSGEAPEPRAFPPLTHINRIAARFIKSEEENKFVIDVKKMAFANRVTINKPLPSLTGDGSIGIGGRFAKSMSRFETLGSLDSPHAVGSPLLERMPRLGDCMRCSDPDPKKLKPVRRVTMDDDAIAPPRPVMQMRRMSAFHSTPQSAKICSPPRDAIGNPATNPRRGSLFPKH